MDTATRTCIGFTSPYSSVLQLLFYRFVVVSVLGTRHSTPVIKRSLNPVYAAKDATFDFPIYLSTADKLGVIEAVIWDKDVVGKEYLGEVSIPLEDWFRNDNSLDFEDPDNKVCPTYLVANFLWLNLEMDALAPKSQCGFHPK